MSVLSVLDEPINIERAQAAGACASGLGWAEAHPDATVRQLASEAPLWASWYLTQAKGMTVASAGRALLGMYAPDLSDVETVRAACSAWQGADAVRLLSHLWWDNDDRLVRALADAGWKRGHMAHAMGIAWWGDEQRLIGVMARSEPKLTDVQMVSVLSWPWASYRLVVCLCIYWLDENRVARALLDHGGFGRDMRAYIEGAWDWYEGSRPPGLVRLADEDPVPAHA